MFGFGSKERPQPPLTPAQIAAWEIARLRLLADAYSYGPSMSELSSGGDIWPFYNEQHNRADELNGEIQRREQEWFEQFGPIPRRHFKFYAPDIRRHAEQNRGLGVEPQPWLLAQLQPARGRRRS